MAVDVVDLVEVAAGRAADAEMAEVMARVRAGVVRTRAGQLAVWAAPAGTVAPAGVDAPLPEGFAWAGVVSAESLLVVDPPPRWKPTQRWAEVRPPEQLVFDWLQVEERVVGPGCVVEGGGVLVVETEHVLVVEGGYGPVGKVIRTVIPRAVIGWEIDAGGAVSSVTAHPDDDTGQVMLTYWRPEFTCPVCERSSAHPVDGEEGYCGSCRAWTRDPMSAAVFLADVYDRAVVGEAGPIPSYTVGSEPGGGFVIHIPEGATRLDRTLITGDVARRFMRRMCGVPGDPFDGLREVP